MPYVPQGINRVSQSIQTHAHGVSELAKGIEIFIEK